jgi:tetratricopeptide (TPR) repeat protein
LFYSLARGDALESLGGALWALYETSKTAGDLEEVIKVYDLTLQERPEGHPRRKYAVYDMGYALWRVCDIDTPDRFRLRRAVDLLREAAQMHRSDNSDYVPAPNGFIAASEKLGDTVQTAYDESGRIEDLEEAIMAYEDVLADRGEGHERRKFAVFDLGYALWCLRHHHALDEEQLRRIVGLFREAVKLRTPEDPTCQKIAVILADALEKLGDTLDAMYEESKRPDVLERTIAAYEEALNMRPQDYSWRYLAAFDLGQALWTFCERYPGHDSRLNQCIDAAREAVSLCPPAASNWNNIRILLAGALLTDSRQRNIVEREEEALLIMRDVLSHSPSEHLTRETVITVFSNALLYKFTRHGDLTTLDEAIMLFREALSLCARGHPDRAESLCSLADALSARYRVKEDDKILSEAIALYHEATSTTDLPTNAVGSLAGLATAMKSRYDREGRKEILTEAIELQRRALQLTSLDDPIRYELLGNLGAMLATVHQQLDHDRISEAIEVLRQSAALCPPNSPDRAGVLQCLADALLVSFDNQGGSPTLLDEAVTLDREAVSLCPTGHPRRYLSLCALGAALRVSYHQNGQVDILSEAIEVSRQGLALCPSRNPFRHVLLDHVAVALYDWFVKQGDTSVLAECIDLQEEALALRPRGHPLRVRSLLHLANALQVSETIDGFQRLLALRQEILELCPIGHPSRGAALANFAWVKVASISTKAVENAGSQEDLEMAIHASREALELCPINHPRRLTVTIVLGSLLCRLALRSKSIASWEESMMLFDEALQTCPEGHHQRAFLLRSRAPCLLSPSSPFFNREEGLRFLKESLEDPSVTVGRLQHVAADLRLAEEAFDACLQVDLDDGQRDRTMLDLYRRAIHLLPRAANFGLDHTSRLLAVANSDEIARHAAVTALRLGDISAAVEMLETGRGVFWSQALHLRSPELDILPATERHELEGLFRALQKPMDQGDENMSREARVELTPDERRRLSSRVEDLIASIRTLPGLGRFLMPCSFDDLMRSLPDGFVVILVASSRSSHAILLNGRSGLVQSIPLQPPPGGFFSGKFQAVLPRGRSAKEKSMVDRALEFVKQRVMFHVSRKKDPDLESCLCDLWSSIVKPVIDALDLKVGLTLP